MLFYGFPEFKEHQFKIATRDGYLFGIILEKYSDITNSIGGT